MHTCKNSCLPGEVTFQIVFYDENWNELKNRISYTNDCNSIARLLHNWRCARFEKAKGFEPTDGFFAEVSFIGVEVIYE